MRWAVADVEFEYTFDGQQVDADFMKDFSVDIETVDEITARTEARAVRWRLLLSDGAAAEEFSDFYSFARRCSAYALNVVFVFNGVNFFHAVDVARLWDIPDRWETVTNERDEHGLYKGRNKEAYIERSGANGERYSFTIWTRSPLIGGNRHNRLRSTKFVNLDNILTCGEVDACDTFAEGRRGLSAWVECVKGFAEVCTKNGLNFLTEKGISHETIGGIAKFFLLHEIGTKRTKNACALTPKQWQYLNRGKIMRGGICFCNAESGREYKGVYGYDVNSEYLRVASTMSELSTLMRSSWEQYQNDESGDFVYIITFDDLFVELRDGEIPVFKGTQGDQITGGICATQGDPICIFGEELEAISQRYDIIHFHVHSVLRCKKMENKGYKNFAEKWYAIKEQATETGDKGLRFLAKMVINSALGKLAQKSVYDKTTHEAYKPCERIVRAVTRRASEEEYMAEHGALSYVQGAYVTALARVYYMETLSALGGDRAPADCVLYGDTDSFYMTKEAPAELCGSGCGQLKTECKDGKAKFIAKKCYAHNSEKGTEIHISGTRRADFIAEAEKEGIDATDGAALVSFLRPDMEVQTSMNVIIPGGRAMIYRKRLLSGEVFDLTLSGHKFGRGRSAFFEL